MERSVKTLSLLFHDHPYLIYVITSLSYSLLITIFALWPAPKGCWNFLNSKPKSGEMGFGRFIIRGSRYINGQYTPFAYPWRQVEPSTLGLALAWSAYIIHQVGQWFILAKVQKMGTKLPRWSSRYRWWNWKMLQLNIFMMLFKLIHGHIFYDGLAIHVPEGIAQGSVVLILVLAIVLAIPYRGVIFGRGKRSLNKSVMRFIQQYHGYAMSVGTVLNFHYHPVEGTMGHCFGFMYQCFLLWQSTNFLHKSHRNRSWILLLEIWSLIHGTLTAIIQPGIGWQIFSYGFMAMFLLNQIFQTKISNNPYFMIILYLAFACLIFVGFRKDKAYYRATFIPVAEYACVCFVLAIGTLINRISLRLTSFPRKAFIIFSTISVCICLTIGLALILAGTLTVYNDY